MNIGQASTASGVSQRMIRHYEKIGLVPAPPRRGSGYRDYDESDVHRLGFVRSARNLGFTIEQIGELLALWGDRTRASADVQAMALAHVEGLRSKVVEIERMIATLETLAESCRGDLRADYPMIEGLALGGTAPAGNSGARRVDRAGDRQA